jgi:16S rRNA (guanine527-N7)-methyltransferase
MQSIFVETLTQAARQMEIELSVRQMEQCAHFADMLVNRNKELNLTTLVQPEEIALKHFADSFTCLGVGLWPPGCRAVDVGTGAGFPGVPLAILRPDVRWVLADALRKRVSFVEEVLAELQLKGVRCLHLRAEDLGRDADARESFDVAVARAVSRLPVVLEYCVPLVKIGGGVMAMKGPDVEDEVAEAGVAARKLGVDPAVLTSLELPGGSGGRTLVWYRKSRPTPLAYPRRAGLVQKRPL